MLPWWYLVYGLAVLSNWPWPLDRPPSQAGLSLGSPSFSIFVLKTNELEKYLVVAR
jgi:hypothetical protein